MKLVFKILGVIIILILALAFIIPIIFKDQIIEVAKEEINKNVEAKVDFDDFSLSLFKNFPNFQLSLKGLSVVGLHDFENDTLANIQAINITLGLFSVINGDTYEVKKIIIINPNINISVLEDGQANYDITLSEEEETNEIQDSEKSSFALSLKHFEIVNANFSYKDYSANTFLELFGLNHTLNGNLTESKTNLRTVTKVDKLNMDYGGIRYISDARLDYTATIDADLKNEIYTLQKNELRLNELLLTFDGSVSYVNEDLNLVLTFNAPKTEFKNILSLIPAVYSKDFETIKTDGSLQLEGYVKGIYNEQNLPAFNLNLDVDNAIFQYPDLPQSVSNINISTKISNKGGDADNTIVDVSKFNMTLGNNPFEITLLLKTPISDPDINATFKGKMDLGTINEFYPMDEGEDLSGTFVSDITLLGKMSAIENEDYSEFTAMGSILLRDIKYKSNFVHDDVEISNAQLNFSPQYLDLVAFNTTIGKSDFQANGKITNYLAYYLKGNVLKGNLETNSKYFNLSSLMTEEESESTSEPTSDSITLSVIEIPSNIDFQLQSNFGKLIYDNLEMNFVKGSVFIKDSKAILKDLEMELLDGSMVINGSYSSENMDEPGFDFDLDINQIDIQKSFNAFRIISEYAPIAKKTSGKFSSEMSISSTLDKYMDPLYETITGEGMIETSKIKIEDVNTFNKIADILKLDKLISMDINKVLIQFEFVNGRIVVEPFEIKYEDYIAQLGGSTGFDKSIDYVMNLNIPRAEFGSAANDILSDLVNKANNQGANFSLGETVSLDVLIGGFLSDPTIKTGLKESGTNVVKEVTEQVKEQVKEEVEKKKEEISQEAKQQAQKIIDDANKKAKQLIDEAEKQAENIRKEAANAAQKLKDEAEIQAKKIEEEGKKNGFLAEAAAKETANHIRKEADNQANNLTSEADKKANGVVNTAKQQAKKIKDDAQKQADKILGNN